MELWGEPCMNRYRAAYALQNFLWRKMLDDMVVTGHSFIRICRRRWWNPLCYIVGSIYVKRIKNQDILKKEEIKWLKSL